MEEKLGAAFWNTRYENGETGWDLGKVSPPIQAYIDQVTDRSQSVLIPGCGNAYEAQYLLENGFTNVTIVDISPILCQQVIARFSEYIGKKLTVICGDFFKLSGRYSLIFEQTFFCALDPALRQEYAKKMGEVLLPGEKLVGVLFNRAFEGGPPFGGSREEYNDLFRQEFDILLMEPCYNSIGPRMGTELFVMLRKK